MNTRSPGTLLRGLLRFLARAFQSTASSVFATTVGLATVLIAGMIWWPVGSGPQGIILGAFTAAVCARNIRQRSNCPSSVLAASIGAGIASYFAIATAEGLDPGSFEWASKGGLYGAGFGLPIGAILGPLGAIPKPPRQDA